MAYQVFFAIKDTSLKKHLNLTHTSLMFDTPRKFLMIKMTFLIFSLRFAKAFIPPLALIVLKSVLKQTCLSVADTFCSTWLFTHIPIMAI